VSRQEKALENLAEQHGPRVLAYLARRCETSDDAADVFQAVLMVAWRRLPDIPSEDPAALAWLLSAARKSLANHRRGRTRRLAATDRLRATITVSDSYPESPDQREDALRKAMDKLSEDDRELLRLIYWEDLATEQAAAVVGIMPAAARKRLERARTRLRLVLDADPTLTRDCA
jgi:RNA polymerase sigma factor (sigma-70 family)